MTRNAIKTLACTRRTHLIPNRRKNKLEKMGQNCSIEVPKTDKAEEKKKQIYTSPSVTKLKEEEEERKKQKVVQVKQDKWIKHYCSSHKILIVGEGDFSFSLCLANSFDSASNIVATSLSSIGTPLRTHNTIFPPLL